MIYAYEPLKWVEESIKKSHEKQLQEQQIQAQQQLQDKELKAQRDTTIIIGVFAILIVAIILRFIKKNKSVKNKSNLEEIIIDENILVEKLNKIKKLFDDGIITDEEFKEKRKELIQKYDL